MGLFKKKPEKKPEKTPAQAAAESAKQRGDYTSYFYLSHKQEIDSWDELITQSRVRGKQRLPDDQRFGNLRESKSLLDGFHEWCSNYEYGEEYFNQTYATGEKSMYQRVLREMADCEKKLKL